MSKVEETPDWSVEEEEEEEEEEEAEDDEDEEVVPVACCSCSLNSKCLRCACRKLGGCRPTCPSRKCLYKEKAAKEEKAAVKKQTAATKEASPVKGRATRAALSAKKEAEVEAEEKKKDDTDVDDDKSSKEPKEEEKEDEASTAVKDEVKEEPMDTTDAEASEEIAGKEKSPAAKEKTTTKDGKSTPVKQKTEKAGEKEDDKKVKEGDDKDKNEDEKSDEKKFSKPKKTITVNENFVVPTVDEFHQDLDVVVYRCVLCIGPMDMSDLSNQDIYDCLQKAETFYIRFEKENEDFVGYVDVQFFTEEEKDDALRELEKCGVKVEPILSKDSTKAEVFSKVLQYSRNVEANDETCGLSSTLKRLQTVVLPGIPLDITKEAIAEKLPKAKAILIPEMENGDRRGYAYAEYDTKEEAEKLYETKVKWTDDDEMEVVVRGIKMKVPRLGTLLSYTNKHWITQKPNKYETISPGQKNRLFELNAHCKIYLYRRELGEDQRKRLEELHGQIKKQMRNYANLDREKSKPAAKPAAKTEGTKAATDKDKTTQKSGQTTSRNDRSRDGGTRTSRTNDNRNRPGGGDRRFGGRQGKVQSLLNMNTPRGPLMGPRPLGNMGMGMGNMGNMGNMGMGMNNMGMGMNNMGGGMPMGGGMGNNLMGPMGGTQNRITPLMPGLGMGILGPGPGAVGGNMGGNIGGMGMGARPGMGVGGGMGVGMGGAGGMGMMGGMGVGAGMGGGGGMTSGLAGRSGIGGGGSGGMGSRASIGGGQAGGVGNASFSGDQRRQDRQDNYRDSRQADDRRNRDDDSGYFVGGYDSQEHSRSRQDDKYDEYGSSRGYRESRSRKQDDNEWYYEGGSDDRGSSRSRDDRYSGAYSDYKSGYGRDSDNYAGGDRNRSSSSYGRGSDSGGRHGGQQEGQRQGGKRQGGSGGDRGNSVKDQVHKAAADANLDPSAAVNLLVGLSNILKGNLDVSSLVREGSQQRGSSGGRSSGGQSRGGGSSDSSHTGYDHHGEYQGRYTYM